ncbi:MAG: hypothetical protein Q9183_005695, partial [Haloplaca sp. 2 TL-2023]
MFQEPYSECLCWYCAAIRESHTSSFSRHFSHRSANRKIETHLDRIDDKEQRPHISAHNAIPPPVVDIDKLKLAHVRRLGRLHEKSRQRAEKRGQRVPERNEENQTGFAMPIIIPPYYDPSSPDPAVTGNLYASNPQCGSFTQGEMVNCIAGTCGGAVAAGACAG